VIQQADNMEYGRIEMTMSKAPTMNSVSSTRVTLPAIVATAAALIFGCGTSIAQTEKKDVAKGTAAPSVAETRAIAEEGFIFGLPIVMNYAVMYEYAVDKRSPEFKAPFNQIKNEARVFVRTSA
jgi:hypothetical protein